MRTFRAFSSSGKLLLKVTSHRRGSCYSGSLADQHKDAWRCISGNYLYDPCFSSAKHRKVVLCPDVPRIKTAVEIRLTRKLPEKMANSGHIYLGAPWLMQLVNGLKCEIGTGANSIVDGLVSYYYCGKRHGHYVALWGKLHRKVQPWTVRIGTGTKPSRQYTKVAIAWY
jgi:hypothetical protein